MKKFLTIILAALFVAGGVTAQNTLATVPPSFQFKNSLVQQVNVRKAVMTADVEQLRKEDMERMKDGHPMRVTVGVPVNVELKNAGSDWLSLPDGTKIWQQAVKSEGAHGLILSFDELYIPEGGELFVYTADRQQVQRFDHTTNPGGGAYATTRLYQDEIVLEYVQSPTSTEAPRIKSSGVGYMYRNMNELGDDYSCFININCEEGSDWQIQKQGVVGLSMQFGKDEWYICSGSLVNNVQQDGTPYILTAHHCIDGYTNLTFPTMEFDFFKESVSSNCHDMSKTSKLTKTLVGAELIADIPMNRSSDGTLLKLTKSIPSDWEVYYNGWDARGEAATSGVCIHHPNGLVKKVSTFTDKLESVSYVNMGDGDITGKDTHWDVVWAETTNGHSVTYGGSSGSPLFNQDGLIVGTLTGGDSFCETLNGSDIYGKFSFHFSGYSDSKQHFKNYLDPDNTGTLVLEGFDPHATPIEGAPEALPASEVTQTGFTANWNKMEGVDKYYIDVYTVGNNAEPNYIVKRKNVGDVTSYAVTELEMGTQYRYVVRGGSGSSFSDYSEEVKVTTSAPSLDYYTAVALPANKVSDNAFVANWDAVEGANAYLLNVYTKHGGENAGTETVDFTGQKIPDGWTTSNNTKNWYTSEDYSGREVPSFQFKATGAYLESPRYPDNIKSISFWYRGANASGSQLEVSVYTSGGWQVVKTIQVEGSEDETVVIDELPACTAVSFEYTKKTGNCALDDIVVEYGEEQTITYLDGYEGRDVGNVFFYQVDNVDMNANRYFYIVQATDGELSSKLSNEIDVLASTTGLRPVQVSSAVFVNNESIVIRQEAGEGTLVSVYNITGQMLLSRSMMSNELQISKSTFEQGVYFVMVGRDTHKIVVN